jgi:hypothetical protein
MESWYGAIFPVFIVVLQLDLTSLQFFLVVF